MDLVAANLADAILPQGVDLVVYKKGQQNSSGCSKNSEFDRAEYAEVLEIQDVDGNSVESYLPG